MEHIESGWEYTMRINPIAYSISYSIASNWFCAVFVINRKTSLQLKKKKITQKEKDLCWSSNTAVFKERSKNPNIPQYDLMSFWTH